MKIRFRNFAGARIFAVLLAVMIMMQAAAGLAFAEETVTSIELDAVPTPIQLYVEDGAVSLVLRANIQGSATPRVVTNDAVWTSSSTSVKVDKGVLSATGSVASATITAKYKTFTATANVKADYRYTSLKLENPAGTESPDQLDIELDEALDLSAVAYENDGEEVPATATAQWLTSNTAVATVSGGVVTLVSAGTVTITAKLKGRADSIVLKITSPYESVDIQHAGTDAIELYVGDAEYSLTARATFKNQTTEDITLNAAWASSNSNVVKVTNGKVTAVGPGSAIVTAKRYGVSDAVTLYVRTPYEALKLTTSKPLAMTLYGAPVEVSATGMKGSSVPVDVSADAQWTVADPLVAMIEKANGKIYVKPKAVGSTKLTLSYKGLTKELPISVFPSVSTLTITKDVLDVFEGESNNLPAVKAMTVAGDEADVSRLVVWKSGDESILTIADGKWTAKASGTVTLTAEVENEPNAAKKTDTLQVNVHKKVLALIPSSTAESVVIGQEAPLPKVRLVYTDGEEKDVTSDVEWKTSSANLLIKSGKMKGLLASSVTLTGTYLNKTVTIKVQVEEEFTTFEIEPKLLQLTLNRTQSVKVTGTTKSGKKIPLSSRISWSTSSEELVTVKGGTVKGLAEGTGKLTAKIQGKPLEIAFIVRAKLTKLTASDKSLSLKVGDTDTITLTAGYENGKTEEAAKLANWSSSASKVVTVTGGVVKAVGKGTATVKAAFGGKTVSIRITVK